MLLKVAAAKNICKVEKVFTGKSDDLRLKVTTGLKARAPWSAQRLIRVFSIVYRQDRTGSPVA